MKIDADLEPELDIADKPELKLEPEVVDGPDPEIEVEDPPIGTHVALLAELTMKLSSSVMRVPLFLRSLDVYDSLQIFLEAT